MKRILKSLFLLAAIALWTLSTAAASLVMPNPCFTASDLSHWTVGTGSSLERDATNYFSAPASLRVAANPVGAFILDSYFCFLPPVGDSAHQLQLNEKYHISLRVKIKTLAPTPPVAPRLSLDLWNYDDKGNLAWVSVARSAKTYDVTKMDTWQELTIDYTPASQHDIFTLRLQADSSVKNFELWIDDCLFWTDADPYAGEGAISGKLRDQATNLPMGDVDIELSGPAGAFSTKTDEAGDYAFNNIPAGEYELSASLEAYKSFAQGVDLRGFNEAKVVDIALEPCVATSPPLCLEDFESGLDKVSVEAAAKNTEVKTVPGQSGVGSALSVTCSIDAEKNALAFNINTQGEVNYQNYDQVTFFARGEKNTTDVEVLFIQDDGRIYEKNLKLSTVWRECVMSVRDIVPHGSTPANTYLDFSKLKRIRFCFWESLVGQGEQGIYLDDIYVSDTKTVGIEGAVLDGADPVQRGLAGAIVRFYQGEQLAARAQTQQNGSFSFSGYEAGDYTLKVEKEGYQAFSETFQLGSGILAKQIILRPKAISIALSVQDQTGAVADAIVDINGKVAGKSDENGQLLIKEGLAPGSFPLTVRKKGYYAEGDSIELAWGAQVEKTVTLTVNADDTPPGEPTTFAADVESLPGRIALSWQGPEGEQPGGYAVYRVIGNDSPVLETLPRLIVNAQTLSWVDEEVIGEMEYTYYLVALDEANNASQPVQLKATPTPTGSLIVCLRTAEGSLIAGKVIIDDKEYEVSDNGKLLVKYIPAGTKLVQGQVSGLEEVSMNVWVQNNVQREVVLTFHQLDTSRLLGISGVVITPLPFRPSRGGDQELLISFVLDQSITYEIEVSALLYDMKGRLVKIVADKALLTPGGNVLRWDGTDQKRRIVNNGPYILRLVAKGKATARTASFNKMIFVLK